MALMQKTTRIIAFTVPAAISFAIEDRSADKCVVGIDRSADKAALAAAAAATVRTTAW